jgi:hypothetical protein
MSPNLDDAGDNSAEGAASLSLLRAEDALPNSQGFTTGFFIKTVQYSITEKVFNALIQLGQG